MMNLSKEQQTDFDSYNEKLGFSKEVVSQFPSSSKAGAVVLSADPAKSSVPPKVITVNNLDELKELIGMPETDTHSFMDHSFIRELLEKKNDGDLTKDDRHNVKLGATSYILGNSSGLKGTAMTTIYKAMFPMTLAAFTAENFTVTPENPLVLGDGTVNNFGTVTVEEGGQIESGTATLRCQNLIQQGPVNPGTYTIKVELPSISPTQAQSGDAGNSPTEKGPKGQNGVSCGSHCKTKPTDGGQGPGGQPGGNGHEGLNGAHGPILTCNIANAEGNISIYAGSQKGQDGGNGGNGGNGGPGGDPGDCPSQCNGSCASQGPSGNGGDGGNGGNGGDGGNGAQVYFSYSGSPSIFPTAPQSEGGNGGSFGTGGTGNENGSNGSEGEDGTGGKDPIISY